MLQRRLRHNVDFDLVYQLVPQNSLDLDWHGNRYSLRSWNPGPTIVLISHLSTAAGITSAGGSIGKRSDVLNSNTLQLILISMQEVIETWAVGGLKEVRSSIEMNQGNMWQEVATWKLFWYPHCIDEEKQSSI